MITLYNTPKSAHSTSKLLGAAETHKRLEQLFYTAFNPEIFEGMFLDKRETARFIAEKVRILRIAANASGLRTLTFMIENTFYEAYSNAQSRKSENIEFVSATTGLQ